MSMTIQKSDNLLSKGSPPYEVMVGEAPLHQILAVQLWREGELGTSQSETVSHARYRWFYLDNPEGQARVHLLMHTATQSTVGFMGIGRRQMFADGKKMDSGTLVDYVVVPKHRSAFPALLLQRKAREIALEFMSILYGLPDVKARMISKRLGSDVSFELPRFARVIRGKSYFERHLPGWLAAPLALLSDSLDWLWIRTQLTFGRNAGEWVERFDQEFDQLWMAFRKQDFCIGIRDSAFLNWRFTEQPGHQYRTFIVRSKGSLIMYFVCEVSGETLSIKDCLNIGSEADFKQGLLLLSLEARGMNIKAVEVQASFTKPHIRALRRAQFALRSSRPFFAVIRESLKEQATKMHWYITPADEDV